MLVILPLYVLTFKIFNPHIRQASERVGQHLGRISGNVHEQISAVALTKSYAAEEREARRFMADNMEHYGHVIHQSRVGHGVGAISETPDPPGHDHHHRVRRLPGPPRPQAR